MVNIINILQLGTVLGTYSPQYCRDERGMTPKIPLDPDLFCNREYQYCKNGRHKVRQCNHGSIFNKATGNCVSAEGTECSDGNSNGNDVDDYDDATCYGNEGKSSCWRVGTGCRLYGYCQGETLRTEQCPVGTWYDSESDNCESTSSLSCDHRCSEIECPNPTTTATTTASTTTASTTTTSNEPVDERCLDSPTGVGPNQPNYDIDGNRICGSFGNCVNGKYIHKYCPKGEYFDRVIKRCYPVSSLPCGTDCSPSCSTEPTTTITVTPAPTTTTVVDPQCVNGLNEDRPFNVPSCSNFISCRNGKYSVGTCPSGYYFDIVSNVCYKISSLPCGARCSPPCPTTTMTTTGTELELYGPTTGK